jgi:pimeloyl-ACP methyl ester carboxylesterase
MHRWNVLAVAATALAAMGAIDCSAAGVTETALHVSDKKAATRTAASKNHVPATYRIETIARRVPQRQHAGGARVILLKGLADVFSNGMDALGVELQRRGIAARVTSHAAGPALADDIARDYRAGARGPIVLVGHSFGADAAAEMANQLNESKVPVALLVAFGTTASTQLTPNVARAVNYYQSSSAWRGRLLPGAGFHGSLANIDLDKMPGINHFNIDKVDRLHADTVNRIVAVVGGRWTAAPHHHATRIAATMSGDTR